MSMAAPQTLQARVHKLLHSRSEMEASKALLHTLVASDMPLVVAPATASAAESSSSLAALRTNLRSSLEDTQMALAQSVLDGLSHTLAQLAGVRTQVDALDAKCTQLHTFLESTKRETQQVQAQAATLAGAKRELQRDFEHISSFLGQYQLTEDEIQALYHPPSEDMAPFFAVMERVQQVKTDCKTLVGTGDINCSLELLDTVGKYQEVGFEKLYQWTAKQCNDVDGEPSAQLHRAIAILRDRAEFYNYCKECITSSRRSLLVRRFIVALTRGGPNGIPRPIELHAHDPVRYCGDMLAWVHQAIATESEFFRVLFDGDLSYHDSTEVMEGQTDEDASMVGRAFEGVARPLQVRVEQTLAVPHGIVIAYKLVHLLAFYDHTFNRLVGPASGIARALAHCREASDRAFMHQLRVLVDSVANAAPDYATNLAATQAAMDVAQRLGSLLEVFQSSMLPQEEKEAGLAPLLDGLLPAVGQLCRRSIEVLPPMEALVFQINNLSCMQLPLSRFPEAATWTLRLTQDLERWVKEISELQAKSVLDRSHVSSLLQQIHTFQTSEEAINAPESASRMPGLDGESISRAMSAFCAALLALVFPQFDQIVQPDIRERARQLTLTQLATTYAFVYAFVHDPKYGYKPTTASSAVIGANSKHVLVLHTPRDVRTVLDIE